MLTIPIQVSGDCWNNQTDVKQLLDQTRPGDRIMLDLCSEGPSLHRLGVVDLVDQYRLEVCVTRWSNSIESVPYRRVFCNSNSHFFPMSHHYWVEEIPNFDNAEFRFALFLGRGCPSRNRILYDVYHRYSNSFLLSKMSCGNGDPWGIKHTTSYQLLETMKQWFDSTDLDQTWFDRCPIVSIDNHNVQDQFVVPEVSSGNMARSLLQHYQRFNVELVCETYTLGETFFPTEKTIRPIIGNRPFLVHGPVNYLNNLRQRGFKTFGELWDESYDKLEGMCRWLAMRKLIDGLSTMSQTQWNQTIQHCKEIVKHNRNQVRKIIRDLKGI